MYSAPPDPGGAQSVTLTVQVAGCPDSASVTLHFGAPPSATPPVTPTAPPTPAGSATPATATATPTSTPEPSATPEEPELDLRIVLIEVFQPIEDSDLAAHKRTVVRVYPDITGVWTGKQSQYSTRVALYVNDRLFKSEGPLPIRNQVSFDEEEIRRAEDSVNFFLPGDWMQPGPLELRAVIDPDDAVKETDETNNENTKATSVFPSRGISLLVVMLDQGVQPGTVSPWADQARRFLLQTYPVPSVRVVRGYGRINGHLNLPMAWLDAMRVDMNRRVFNLANAKNPANQAEYAVGVFSGTPYGSWLGKIIRGMSFATYRRAPLVSQDFPLTLAHEIGHAYNGGVEEYSSTQDGIPIRGWRYDLLRDRLYLEDGSPDWINFMGDPHASGVSAWVNQDTYNQILRGRHGAHVPSNRTLAAAATTGRPVATRNWTAHTPFDEVLLVAGSFDENGEVVLLPPLAMQANQVEAGPGGPYLAELQSADGSLLASASFDVDTQLGEYDAPNPGLFSFEVPYPSGTSRLLISHSDQVIHTLERSPSPPDLSVGQPAAEARVTGEATVDWTASDSDGDELSYTVLYSPDEGDTWLPLAIGWPDQNLPIDGSQLPGGEAARIRVLASDGLNTVSADSSPFSVPRHAPTVSILPANAEAEPWVAGRPNTLAAIADDVEDGWLPDSAYQWTSDRDGPMGQGSALHVNLSEGTHVISVVVTDADGQTASASTTVTVAPTESLVGPVISTTWLYGVGLLGLLLLATGALGTGVGLFSRRRLEPSLAYLTSQAATLRQQARSGQIHPSQVQPLTAQDQRGQWWSLNPLQNQWQRWNGTTWQPARPYRSRRCGCLLVALLSLGLGGMLVLGTGILLVPERLPDIPGISQTTLVAPIAPPAGLTVAPMPEAALPTVTFTNTPPPIYTSTPQPAASATPTVVAPGGPSELNAETAPYFLPSADELGVDSLEFSDNVIVGLGDYGDVPDYRVTNSPGVMLDLMVFASVDDAVRFTNEKFSEYQDMGSTPAWIDLGDLAFMRTVGETEMLVQLDRYVLWSLGDVLPHYLDGSIERLCVFVESE